jgi:Flp pilus assembly protein TadG
MRSWWRRVAGDECGQALVFVMLALGVLITVVALVLSVGSWMHTQRDAQSVADAAALAGVQRLPVSQQDALDAVQQSVAANGWAGTLSSFVSAGDPSTIQVDTHQPVTGFFEPIAGVFDLTITTHARATYGPPASLANVIPVAVRCSSGCGAWVPGVPVSFTYRRRAPDTSTFAPVQLPDVNDRNDFKKYVQCDPENIGGNCNSTKVTAPGSYDRLLLGNCDNGNGQGGNGQGNCGEAGRVRADLGKAEGMAHYLPVFDSYSPVDGYHVVGWAEVDSFTVDPGGGRVVTINVTFKNDVIVKGTSLPSRAAQKPDDFGLRAFALTG